MTSEAMPATVHRSWAADLGTGTLYEILRLRVDVFVVEQACPYAELDGRDLDERTRHYWLGGDGHPEPVLGCLRLLEERGGEYRIGRLCTARSARGRGLGKRLMEAALAEVGDAECVLDAQEHLADFYRGFGFAPSGPVYDWDGVAHVPMRRERR
ncbi:GNAT family N-acetyltransferase [Pseudonocardia nigra]|uniref:GNAT family N-acetyltransferase n=1 Tax=Pseudonocardia nigra TaxID=1921578 RepID=UPI001C5E53C1|nr:GNAT family N-acetyltransferase [Pseudonocardia nigra]